MKMATVVKKLKRVCARLSDECMVVVGTKNTNGRRGRKYNIE